MARFTITRRTVLRGAGGLALALPPLEAMGAASIPKRYCVLYGGISTGAYGKPSDYVVPTKTGNDYDLTRGTLPLGGGKDYASVKADVGIVSKLVIPWDGAVPTRRWDGTPITQPLWSAKAGPQRPAAFHGNTMAIQLSGCRPKDRSGKPPDGRPTSDQIVAEAISAGAPRRSIALQVQPRHYFPGGGGSEPLSVERGGRTIQSISEPRVAYNTLFGASSTAAGSTTKAGAAALERRKSILDLVAADRSRLARLVGNEDRQRLERYYDEIQSYRRGLKEIACAIPPAPTEILPIGGDLAKLPDGNAVSTATTGWSDETRRGELLTQFIATAFACDITRVATLQITLSQCDLGMTNINGKNRDMHGMGHYQGGAGDMADAVAWHVRHFALLVARLRDLREVDGSSVLAHTAVILLFEGGHGWDPEGDPRGENIYYKHSSDIAHSTENMCAFWAGAGLKPGHREAPGCSPGQVVLTAMNAIGVAGPLGDIKDALPV